LRNIKLKIPEDEIIGFFIDGKIYTGSHVPEDNAEIEIFPAILGG